MMATTNTRIFRLGAGLLTILLLLPNYAVASDGLWQVDIDEGPAPPPRLRPPFSRHARYDPSLLKYQIPGVVGGYVGFVLIILFCIITFGRRLRRDAQAGKNVGVEMVKPLKHTLDPSPVSPSSTTMLWAKWGGSRKGTPSLKSDESPIQPSVVSFDDKILEKDKMLRQEEMERLYAAVMAQDAKAPRTLTLAASPPLPNTQPQVKSPGLARSGSSSSRNFSQPQPGPRVDHQPTSPPAIPTMPPQPAHTRNITSPHDPFAYMPTSPPTAEISSPGQPSHRTRVPSPPQTLPAGPRSGPTPPPPPSHSRQASNSSQKSRSGRGNVRNLQISAPILKSSFPEPQDRYYEMDTRTPLSPHYVPSNPGRPPSPPVDERPDTPFEEDTEEELESPPFYRGTGDTEDADDIIHAYGGEDIDQAPQNPRQPAQLTIPTLSVSHPSNSSGDLPLRQQQNRTPVSAGTTANTLPFRAIHPPPPVSPSKSTQPYQTVSPGPLKTTFLSPRRDRFLPGGMNAIGPGGVPNSAALLSAGLATPYSPYMPFSPMTPVTPHLPNRRERREQERETARMVPTEEDRVKDDEELWGYGDM